METLRNMRPLPLITALLLALAIALSLRGQLSAPATLYVNAAGNDSNAGTDPAAPFQTIQAAANAAASGTTIQIAPGVYRETVTPPVDGLTFVGAGAGTVVSGCGATPVDLGDGLNQCFVATNGVETQVPEATVSGLFGGVKLAQSGPPAGTPDTAVIGIPSESTNLTGGTIVFNTAQGWTWQAGSITVWSPGSITVSFIHSGLVYNDPVAGCPFRIYSPNLTPGPGQCVINGAKVNFGTMPPNSSIEFKQRPWAFDLTGRSNTTIKNLGLFACTIRDSYASSNNVINGIQAQYVGWDNFKPNGWANLTTTGIQLYGKNDVIENSTIQYSSGNAIVLGGTNDTAANNILSNLDSAGGDEAGILTGGTGHQITYNTISFCGRDGIKQSGTTHVLLKGNLIHDVMTETCDGGGEYVYGGIVTNSVWENEVVYNVRCGHFGGVAHYADDFTSGLTIRNCLANNVDHALKMNSTPTNIIYDHCSDYDCTDSVIGDNSKNWATCALTNNIMTGLINPHTGGDFTGTINTATPGYANPSGGDFTLLKTSPAYASGAGAFAPGQPAWPYGSTVTAPPTTAPSTQPTTAPIKPTPDPVIPSGKQPASVGATLYAQEMSASNRATVPFSSLPEAVAVVVSNETLNTTGVLIYSYSVSGEQRYSAHYNTGPTTRIVCFLSQSGQILRKYTCLPGQQ